jgi:hypothetical protein
MLRRRGEEESVRNWLCVLASDRGMPALVGILDRGRSGLVTVANALHWMDMPALFAAAHQGAPPGRRARGHHAGVPLWLADADWARALNA